MATCTITGKLIDVNGQPRALVPVRATPVSERGAPIFSSAGELVDNATIATQTDENGHFALAIAQGIDVVLTIDAIGYSHKITVPLIGTVDIKDV